MKTAVIIFPGSNCDRDMIDALERSMGWEVAQVWHKDSELPEGLDLVALPGGFSYGDHLRAGAIAKFSPIMDAVVRFANAGGLVIGVCNGFQILTECGLLPGALVRNRSLRFRCHDVYLTVENKKTPFSQLPKTPVRIPIAHGEGCYNIDAVGLAALKKNNQIVFRYSDASGKIVPEANPNGSIESIAGVCNKQGNVLGMMPHPERACEELVGGTDGRLIFDSIGQTLGKTKSAAR